MDVVDTLRVLCRESGRRSHGIAAVGSDYFLVGLEATTQQKSERPQWRHEDDLVSTSRQEPRCTYAPPELSEPAITRIRLLFMPRILLLFGARVIVGEKFVLLVIIAALGLVCQIGSDFFSDL